MNSLNIITARVSPPSSPVQSRSNSIASIELESDEKGSGLAEDTPDGRRDLGLYSGNGGAYSESARYADEKSESPGENTPLLHEKEGNRRGSWWHSLPRSFASSIVSSIRWIFATLTSPGVYLIACFYDEQGIFAPMTQLKRLFGVRKGGMDPYEAPEAHGGRRSSASNSPSNGRTYRTLAPRPTSSSGSSTSGASSESELDDSKGGAKSKHARSKSLNPAEELNTARRSIRIKLHNDEALKQRKHRRTQSAVARTKASEEDLSAQLKSPTSPIAALTKYPKTPAPPRPLIPRRQPSYLNIETPIKQQKTLILDLDETLIHSMSKGGRMSTGHMVEVRLNTASLGMGGASTGAAQHPILYWVNKRPYCDEFLRRVCKWFNLVIFTASVQEYADPVIDWLESERKFFSARYYRQHCTYRQGAYIKDLSSVEPDLSKVMILDNSPLSYLFHEDNAIPIQGWINDPTDNDLMHLVPLLEGLQYVHDVRALLALRGGEEGQHTA
ncbi:nuclear envelope morphology protein 1 [Purpureocillium lilacinum]|uniref:Nuclear envelope morphology protein 1 n=1 Tax=Purpureocillium lilacinum TaxID=33203 RepID=A0A179HIR9_PURLI|nr:nuclear envelope morphology protein 1 [Purpureocillium lilacinum]OAQ90346.1 nuclear envelope morphology protein 1 [Purpureocillium lilacinum]